MNTEKYEKRCWREVGEKEYQDPQDDSRYRTPR
jgi:hypothetical protein